MAVDMVAIVGQENMNLDRKEQVIAILQAQPVPATTKRYLYARWARLLGVQAIPSDVDRVALWSQSA